MRDPYTELSEELKVSRHYVKCVYLGVAYSVAGRLKSPDQLKEQVRDLILFALKYGLVKEIK